MTRFSVGDTVGVGCLVDSCRTCPSCRAGLEQYCETGFVGTYNGPDKALGVANPATFVSHGDFSSGPVALCLFGIFAARLTPEFLLREMLVRFGRNAVLILSLLIPILAGLGLNFGIVIGAKSEWGKGYGTEATSLMVQYAFETLNLNRVWLHVYEFNTRGTEAFEKQPARCGSGEIAMRRVLFQEDDVDVGVLGHLHSLAVEQQQKREHHQQRDGKREDHRRLRNRPGDTVGKSQTLKEADQRHRLLRRVGAALERLLVNALLFPEGEDRLFELRKRRVVGDR